MNEHTEALHEALDIIRRHAFEEFPGGRLVVRPAADQWLAAIEDRFGRGVTLSQHDTIDGAIVSLSASWRHLSAAQSAAQPHGPEDE